MLLGGVQVFIFVMVQWYLDSINGVDAHGTGICLWFLCSAGSNQIALALIVELSWLG